MNPSLCYPLKDARIYSVRYSRELDFIDDDGYLENDDEAELDLELRDIKWWDGQPSNGSIWYKPKKEFKVIGYDRLEEEKLHKSIETIKGEKTTVKDQMENVDHVSMSLLFGGFEPKNGDEDANEVVLLINTQVQVIVQVIYTGKTRSNTQGKTKK